MSFVLIDPRLLDQVEIVMLSDKALAAHIRAICEAPRRPDPTFLPRVRARLIATRSVRQELMAARLWFPVEDGFRLATTDRRGHALWRIEGEGYQRRRWNSLRRRMKQLVFERDGYRCVLCGTEEQLEVDHRIPLARGGSNDFDNLQTMCGPCNRKKRVS